MRGKSSRTSKLLSRIKSARQKTQIKTTAKTAVKSAAKSAPKPEIKLAKKPGSRRAAIKKIISTTKHRMVKAFGRLTRAQAAVGAQSSVPVKKQVKPEVVSVLEPVVVGQAVEITAVKNVPGKRDLGEQAKYNLPWRYNDDRIVILPRDPWWIYSYWDITQNRIDAVVNNIPDDERYGLKWVLRVHDVTGVSDFDGINSVCYFDIDIYFDATSWYINTDKPGRGWCVEIGFVSHKGKFYMVARSNIISSPRFGISSNIDEEWALPDEEYFRLLGAYDLGRSSMSMKRRFEEVVKQQISSQMASWNLSSMTSPMGGKENEADQFFLEVWTELILHGRTHADATVTVEGKKVNLRPDGTFTLRYALPVGDYKYEVTGVSKNRKHKITKTPAVKRFEK